MKKITTFAILAVFIFTFVLFPASATESAAENMAVTQGCHSADGAFSLIGETNVIENCMAAFVYETNSQTILYGQNQDELLYPSSIVKIMNAFIACEQGDLDSAVTVTQAVLDTVPISALTVELQDGEVLTLRDLLYCMMVGSGNDAAAVIAHHIAGSEDAFLALMNRKATELGCTSTVYKNVHGLHHEEQVTTARDVAKLLSAAMENETFATIFSAVYYTVPSNTLSEERHLVTGNYMMHKEEDDLYFDSRVVGGRTGVIESGERNIAVVAKNEDMTVVSVVLGARSVTAADGYSISRYGGYLETIDLLDRAFDGYSKSQILYEAQALKQYAVSGADSVVVAGPSVNLSTVLPKGVTIDQLDFRYVESHQLTAPVEKGQKVSAVQVWYNGLCVAQADLFALNGASEIGAVRVTANHSFNRGNGIWLTLLIVMVCVVVVTVSGLRIVKWVKIKQSAPRRRN